MKERGPLFEVVAAGLLGGGLAWMFAAYLGKEPRFAWALDLLTSIVLSAGAAPVFVYLLANTDRTDHGEAPWPLVRVDGRPRLVVFRIGCSQVRVASLQA